MRKLKSDFVSFGVYLTKTAWPSTVLDGSRLPIGRQNFDLRLDSLYTGMKTDMKLVV